jgi:hypothetical protein
VIEKIVFHIPKIRVKAYWPKIEKPNYYPKPNTIGMTEEKAK